MYSFTADCVRLESLRQSRYKYYGYIKASLIQNSIAQILTIVEDRAVSRLGQIQV